MARIPFFNPRTYLADSLIVGQLEGSRRGVTIGLDVRTSPATVDRLSGAASYGSLSPDRRWLTYWGEDLSFFVLEPWPSRDRAYRMSGVGVVTAWLSSDELVSGGLASVNFYKMRIDPDSDPPISQPELWFSDPLFTQTPGDSHVVTHDGGILYMQRLGPNVAHFIRVIPDWVEQMKRAVDEANR